MDLNLNVNLNEFGGYGFSAWKRFFFNESKLDSGPDTRTTSPVSTLGEPSYPARKPGEFSSGDIIVRDRPPDKPSSQGPGIEDKISLLLENEI